MDNQGSAGGIKPLFLLADSQLLFWNEADGPLLRRVRRALGEDDLLAAYLGASNGDRPEYYGIFVAAMETIGIHACRMIPSAPTPEDLAFLDVADVILLAGGDAERGYRAFKAAGLVDKIIARYAAGAVLIGISAGAMQLGDRAWRTGGVSFDTFRLAPMVVAVHDDPDWAELTEVVRHLENGRGIGIPFGGGAVVHADLSLEPIRKALVELTVSEGEVRRALLVPGAGGS